MSREHRRAVQEPKEDFSAEVLAQLDSPVTNSPMPLVGQDGETVRDIPREVSAKEIDLYLQQARHSSDPVLRAYYAEFVLTSAKWLELQEHLRALQLFDLRRALGMIALLRANKDSVDRIGASLLWLWASVVLFTFSCLVTKTFIFAKYGVEGANQIPLVSILVTLAPTILILLSSAVDPRHRPQSGAAVPLPDEDLEKFEGYQHRKQVAKQLQHNLAKRADNLLTLILRAQSEYRSYPNMPTLMHQVGQAPLQQWRAQQAVVTQKAAKEHERAQQRQQAEAKEAELATLARKLANKTTKNNHR